MASYLRATASYTDGEGSGKTASRGYPSQRRKLQQRHRRSPPRRPALASVAENTAAGQPVGANGDGHGRRRRRHPDLHPERRR